MAATPHSSRGHLACAVAALLGLASAAAAASESGDDSARRNRLAGETSPYLLQHAGNPVDWYPWGDEAIERARREDKPIFLSVGYSTCYWCHVMEREVFSDPEIAALMNRWFVNIKVDREERPDLDEIYMTATQLMTRGGGWPNSLFLTPGLEPFYAGTYFPPEDRGGRPGFPKVLRGIHDAWAQDRDGVTQQAANVAAAVRRVLSRAETGGELPAAAVTRGAVDALARRFDAEHGGFGRAPKFPSPASLMLLWEHAERGDGEAREMVLASLRAMGRGAIYDQLDGGFHRYTLDAAWRVPHFEKMLYDNALLAELYAAASVAEGDPELERLARGTLEFVLRELTLPTGAFKSAIDAETDGVEGAYYVWTRDELETALGSEGFELLAPIFGFAGDPNFEDDRYTLYLTAPLAEHAERLAVGRAELLERLEPWLERLRRVRSERPFPRVDDKALADWNGLMIAAMARSGRLLGEPRYVGAAVRAAMRVLAQRDAARVLQHSSRGGAASGPALLDDYAFLLRGTLALAEATGERLWLERAAALADEMERRLAAPGGGWYASADDPRLLVRARTISDGALPSGNGTAILALVELAHRAGEPVYRERAEAALAAFASELASGPAAAAAPTAVRALLAVRSPDAAGASGGPAAGFHDDPAVAYDLAALARSVVSVRAHRRDGPSAGAAGSESGWAPFDLELDIRDGWHVNAQPASQEFLVPTEVGGGARGVVYPAGERVELGFVDEAISVYSGRVEIAGELPEASRELELTYQACDARRCLAPVTRGVAVEERR